MGDWKSIQEKLVEKGISPRAPDLLKSEKIRMVLDICCDQSVTQG
jgi:hypothetical protein